MQFRCDTTMPPILRITETMMFNNLIKRFRDRVESKENIP